MQVFWGCSSVGRALPWHGEGQIFCAGVWVGAQVDPLVIFVGVVGEQCRLLYLQDSV